MDYISTEALPKVDGRSIAQTAGLLLVISFLPFFIHLQWLSGPLVNALLILILFLSGIRSAMLAAVIPSFMALAGGLLPIPLAPVVPFIIIGNIIFILTIDYIYYSSRNTIGAYWKGIIIGALLKFAWLFLSVNYITGLLLKKELAFAVTQMLSWPQFATAVIGGAIAWGILKWLKFF